MLLALWPAFARRVTGFATAPTGPATAHAPLPLPPVLRPDVTTVARTASRPTAITGPAPAPAALGGAWTVTTAPAPAPCALLGTWTATTGTAIHRRPPPPTCTGRVRPGPATLRALALAAAVTTSPPPPRSTP